MEKESCEKKTRNFLRAIGAMSFVAGIAVASSYAIGLYQNPCFKELPEKAQVAIVEDHQEVEGLVERAVDFYKSGDFDNAFRLYKQAEDRFARLKKIDPKHEEIDEKLSKYREVFVGTDQVSSYIKNVENRASRVAASELTDDVWVLKFDDCSFLDVIGPDSVAFYRCDDDAEIRRALIQNHINFSYRWFALPDEISARLELEKGSDRKIESSLEILKSQRDAAQWRRDKLDLERMMLRTAGR